MALVIADNLAEFGTLHEAANQDRPAAQVLMEHVAR